jgi:hypothetical protein
MPKCSLGHEVTEGQRFCTECGEAVPENATIEHALGDTDETERVGTSGDLDDGVSPATARNADSSVVVVTKQTNGLAIAALVLGILWLWWLGSLLALIFGYVARRQVRNSPDTQTGDGLALAGIVLGWVGVVVLVVGGIALAIAATSNNGSTASSSANTIPGIQSGSPSDNAPPTTLDLSGGITGGSSTGSSASGSTPSGVPAGHWVAFLGSFSNESNAENARQQFSSSSVSDASILNSNDYTSLLPNFWVVYADHGFQSAGDTISFCHSIGLYTDHDCHGRYLSTVPGLDGHDPRFTASNGQ